MTVSCLSHTGTAAWHSLTRSRRISSPGLFSLVCNSLQSGVNFPFRGAQCPPFSLFLGSVLMKGVKHLCRWPRPAPLPARARLTSARATGTGTAPAGAAGDGGPRLPRGSSTCQSSGETVSPLLRTYPSWKANFWLSTTTRSSVVIQYNPFLHSFGHCFGARLCLPPLFGSWCTAQPFNGYRHWSFPPSCCSQHWAVDLSDNNQR